jgi:hypothetical protein
MSKNSSFQQYEIGRPNASSSSYINQAVKKEQQLNN